MLLINKYFDRTGYLEYDNAYHDSDTEIPLMPTVSNTNQFTEQLTGCLATCKTYSFQIAMSNVIK